MEKNLKLQKSKWKDKYFVKEDASKLHLALQSILLDSPSFRNFRAYQEVPVSDLVFTKDILYIDWFIESLNIVIELHGIQHYKPTSFINVGNIKTQFDFIALRNRDRKKRYLLEEAGYIFIEIPYTDLKLLDEKYLLNKIQEKIDAKNNN